MTEFNKIEEARKCLGIEEYASLNEIKKAYRRLSLKYHPDRCKDADKSKCKKRFQDVNRAYEVLIKYCETYKVSFKREDVEEKSEEADLYKRFYENWF
ncbi:MAG: DnaJ domain-containing protein [Elusimicrobiota bacterium]